MARNRLRYSLQVKGCLVLAALSILRVVLPAHAEPGEEENVAILMRDLASWRADNAVTNHVQRDVTENGPAMDLITATRTYTRGVQTLEVRFLSGTGTKLPSVPRRQSVETSEGIVRAEKINGYMTMLTTSEGKHQDDAQKSQLVVWLNSSNNGSKILTFTGYRLSAGEILTAATELDWKAFAKETSP